MKKLLFLCLCVSALLAAAGCSKGDDNPNTPDPGPSPMEPVFNAELPEEVGFNYLGTQLSFIVETNQTGWTVTSDASWCHAALSEFQFDLSCDVYDPVDENDYPISTGLRSCRVTVKCGTLFNRTFTVYQESRTFIRVPQETILLSPDGGTHDITLYNNCYRIRVASSASWLTVSLKDRTTLTLTSSARSSGISEPRTAEVTVESELSEGVYRFTVQDAEAGLSSEDYNYGDYTNWD